MERKLIIWLLSLNKPNIWIAEKIKEISNNNNYHISIDSLKNIDSDMIDQNEFFVKKISSSALYKFGESNNKNGYVYNMNDTLLKFNYNLEIYLIILEIIRNNKKLLIKKEFNNSNQSSNSSISDSGDLLFLNKIWRNSFIRNQILFHCKIYKNHCFKFTFKSILELDQYKFKNYLNYVELDFNEDEETDLNDYLEFKLSSNVRILQFSGDFKRYLRPSSLPSTIKNLIFDEFDKIQSTGDCDENSISNKLNNITIKSILNQDDYFYTNLQNGIKKIKHTVYENSKYHFIPTPQLLLLSLLPDSIKSIKIQNENIGKINEFQDIIQINSLPSKLESFKYNFTINHLFDNNRTSIIFPNSLTNLKLINLSIILNEESIKKGFLPPLLLKLNLGGYYGNINKDVLPFTLIKLILPSKYYKTIKGGCLPLSLEYLSFRGSNCNLPLQLPHQQQIQQQDSGGKKLFKSIKSKISKVLKLQQNQDEEEQEQEQQNLPVLIKGSIPINLKSLKLSEYQCFLDILIDGTLTEQHESLTKLSINTSKIYDFSNKLVIDDFNQFEINSKIEDWENNKFIPPSITEITGYTDFKQKRLLSLLPITKIKINSSSTYNPDFIPPTVTNIIFRVHQLEYQINSFKSINNNNNNNYADIKSITLRSRIDLCKLPETLETLYLSNFSINNQQHQQTTKLTKKPIYKTILKNLKQLIISELNLEIDLENEFPNLEVLVIIGNIDVSFKNYEYSKSKLKKVLISNLNINFIRENPLLHSIIQVESINNINSFKKVKHLLNKL